jgi:hypothetical protein
LLEESKSGPVQRLHQFKKYVPLLKYAVAALIFYFIAAYVVTHLDQVPLDELRFDPWYLTLSLVLLVTYILANALTWHFITVKAGIGLGTAKALQLWVYSLAAKYVPGKILSFSILILSYKSAGASVKKITLCLFLETACAVLASVFVMLVAFVTTDLGNFESYKLLALALAITLLLALHPRVLQPLANWGLRLIRQEPVELAVSYASILVTTLLYLAAFLMLGAGLCLFVASFYQARIEHFLYITGSLALAGLVGQSALFVPSGLGVREGVLAFMLGRLMPHPMAGLVSILSRLWISLGELIIVVGVLVYAKLSGASNGQKGG